MKVDLVGHPFAPIGCGECLRSSFRALREVGLDPRVVDVFDMRYGDPELEEEFAGHLADDAGGDVQIFFVNGDEVPTVRGRLGHRLPGTSHKIIQPMWELEVYPSEWARNLEQFDEVWAVSNFIRQAISRAVTRPVFTFPSPVGLRIGSPLGRRYFGIPESPFAFLFAFDLRSYAERKNPGAVLEAFRRMQRARPHQDVVLLLKVGGAAERPQAYEDFQRLVSTTTEAEAGRVVLLPSQMTDVEVKNLLWCSDCFVSLHRSEGFGRLLAEAMLLEKPVIATAYSGNLDFMTPDTACLVSCSMTFVGADSYPFGEGQVWAEPDLDAAVSHMLHVLDDRPFARALGRRAGRYVRTRLSHRAVGLQYLERLTALSEKAYSR